jgi:hypothetical protein
MTTSRRVGLLRIAPALLLLALGCHALHLGPVVPDRPEKDAGPAPPGKRSFRVSQYVFLLDFDLKQNQPIFRELANLREQVYKELQLPSSTKLVQVYLFEDRERYERFMHARYPELPARRAFFVAQPHSVGGEEDLMVYTYWGDRIKEDLRHELTHALLHSVLKEVPLWLDEGLAEYFELPADQKGVNSTHLANLRDSAVAFKPDLARLEQLSQVQQMSPAEYREAWAWVHLMLRDKPEARLVLLSYLQQLRVNPNPGQLGPRLAGVYPTPNDSLGKHLAKLETGKRGVPTAQRDK